MFRKNLPQIKTSDVFLTDGGLETHLIYKKGVELPHFACFTCLKSQETKTLIREYYADYYQVKSLLNLIQALRDTVGMNYRQIPSHWALTTSSGPTAAIFNKRILII